MRRSTDEWRKATQEGKAFSEEGFGKELYRKGISVWTAGLWQMKSPDSEHWSRLRSSSSRISASTWHIEDVCIQNKVALRAVPTTERSSLTHERTVRPGAFQALLSWARAGSGFILTSFHNKESFHGNFEDIRKYNESQIRQIACIFESSSRLFWWQIVCSAGF